MMLGIHAIWLVSLALALGTGPAAADEVLAWNVTTLEAAGAGGQNNVVMTRTLLSPWCTWRSTTR